MKSKRTVVILLSDKRSGSTMFQQELCRHSDIQTVVYSPHTYLETHHWLKAAVMLDVDPALFCGGKVYPGYGTKQNARIYMEDCIRRNRPDFPIPKNNDHALIFQGWEALCECFANPVFFEKSPQYLAHWGCLELILKWIEKTTFQVKIVGLVRNPLAVLYSAQKLFHTSPEIRQYGWMETYENLIRFQEHLNEDQFMLCRYEDIIQQPVLSFGKILKFIGVSEDESIGTEVHCSSLNRWKAEPYFTIQLTESVRVLARQFGYTDEELNNPLKPLPPLAYRIKRKIDTFVKLSLARFKSQIIVPALLRMK